MEQLYILVFILFVISLLISLIPDFYIIYRLHKKHDKIEALNEEIHIAQEKSIENNQEILGLHKVVDLLQDEK